jgi:hypothetical protein
MRVEFINETARSGSPGMHLVTPLLRRRRCQRQGKTKHRRREKIVACNESHYFKCFS